MAPRKKIKRIPDSIFGRASKLMATGASLLGQEFVLRAGRALNGEDAQKTLKARVGQTEDLVGTLSGLKGAAMKAGQLLSIEASDFLPPELIQILRQLYEESASMPFAAVKKILLRELGPLRYARIENLSPEPVAAASIGQVHRAVIDGRHVAIKVQFPGVANSIDSDLALLKKLVQGFLLAGNKQIPVDALFEDLRIKLRHEVDYLAEAESAKAYRKAFLGMPGYIVPELIPDFTTGKVISLSFESATRITDWVNSAPKGADLDCFAGLILNLIVVEFFQLGLVQTDPNYGNFLYHPAERQLVLLDFGATYPFSVKFRSDFRHLAELGMIGSDGPILAHAMAMGLLDARESHHVKELFLKILDLSVSMFLRENQPFHFGSQDFLKNLREAIFAYVSLVRFTPPPKDLVFLNRKLGGMFHLLKELGAKSDLQAYWQRIKAMPLV